MKLYACNLECDDPELLKKIEDVLNTPDVTDEMLEAAVPGLREAIFHAHKDLSNLGFKPETIVINGRDVCVLPESSFDKKSAVYSF